MGFTLSSNIRKILFIVFVKSILSSTLVHVASEKIAEYDESFRGSLLGDKAVSVVFDNSKIKRFVPQFKATVPFSQGIKKSIEWFDAHPEEQKIDQKWNKLMNKIISANNR